MFAKLEQKYSWLPYCAPMVLFMALTTLEGQESLKPMYPILYILKILAVTFLLWQFKGPLKEITIDRKWTIPAIVSGLLMLFMWIFVNSSVSYGQVGSRVAFNPFEEIKNAPLAYAWIAVRLFGLAITVPIMEEIFWKSFALRYATEKDFKSLPLGTFSWGAFAIVTGVFAMAHPEWLPAVIFAAFTGLFFNWTRSLYSVILLHLVTNFGLGIYILVTRDYTYW